MRMGKFTQINMMVTIKMNLEMCEEALEYGIIDEIIGA